MRKLIRGLMTLVSVSSLVFVMSCAGDTPPNTNPTPDSGQVNQEGGTPFPDVYVPPKMDTGTPQVDQYVWPDTTTPGDTWSWPTDTYTGAPFGCKSDADCFGKQCCPTPWGVKVCADACTAAP